MGVPFFIPPFTPEMRAAAIDALDNEFFILGESVHKFEEAFARYCGTKHAVSVSSGTHAIHFALMALGIKSGDEVLTSPASFIASANAVMHAGGTPTFADVRAEDANLDPSKVAEALTDRTKAILPVHLYGRTADMDPILASASERGIPVVEDACQAHGAEYGGKRSGSIGHVGCFSFYTTKNLFVGGDGGMVTTNDEEVALRIQSLRNSGRAPGQQYEHDEIGYTARLNTMQCAIGLAALDHVEAWTNRRRAIADRYRQKLADLPLRLPLSDDGGRRSVYHLFTVNSDKRDALQAWLKEHGVGTGIHYPIPIHEQPVYRDMFGNRSGMYPVTEAHSRSTLSLPMHPKLSDEQVDEACEAIAAFFQKEGDA